MPPSPLSPSLGACADLRAIGDEPLTATAPSASTAWLLLEHPGPWPAAGPPADLPVEARTAVDAATAAGVRLQLVRRVTGRRRDAATVVLASSRPGGAWTEQRTLPDLRALADLDVAALAGGRPPSFGTVVDEPVVLVCTHGRRDVCCSRLGRPLAVLLDTQLPGLVWETSHVGGHRYAPNVVTLPDGSYHGGIGLLDVPTLADAVTSGRVLLRRLRGRAGLPVMAQAADHAVRERTGETRVDAVQIVSCTRATSGQTTVEVLVTGERWRVLLAAQSPGEEQLTSCTAPGTSTSPGGIEVLGVVRLDPAGQDRSRPRTPTRPPPVVTRSAQRTAQGTG